MMVDAIGASVNDIFIEQIKTVIRDIRKVSNRRPDVKAIYQYVSKSSNLNENDVVSCLHLWSIKTYLSTILR